MSDNQLSSILGLLRLLKNTPSAAPDGAAFTYLSQWAQPSPDDETLLRLMVYVQAQVAAAEIVITAGDFVEEGKAGLLETLGGLRQAFSLQGFQNQVRSYLPALDSAISQFAILVSISGPYPDLSKSDDVKSLIEEVQAVFVSIDGSRLDPLVQQTARRHLHVLLTLLQNLNVMGVEAAMAAYAELVIRLRSVSTTASTETKAEVNALWPTFEKWGKRLSSIQEAFLAGSTLIGYGKPALALIKGVLPA